MTKPNISWRQCTSSAAPAAPRSVSSPRALACIWLRPPAHLPILVIGGATPSSAEPIGAWAGRPVPKPIYHRLAGFTRVLLPGVGGAGGGRAAEGVADGPGHRRRAAASMTVSWMAAPTILPMSRARRGRRPIYIGGQSHTSKAISNIVSIESTYKAKTGISRRASQPAEIMAALACSRPPMYSAAIGNVTNRFDASSCS